MSGFGAGAAMMGIQAANDTITSISNNLLGWWRDKENYQREFDFNEEAAENAEQRLRERYEMYQSPEAMLRQYQDAGLSPSLMYENGASGAMGSSAAQGGVAGHNPTVFPFNPMLLADIQLKKAQANNLNADTKKKEEETNLTKEEIKNTIAKTKNTELVNDYQTLQNQLAKETLDYNKERAEWEIKRLKQDYENFSYSIEISKNNAQISAETKDEIVKQTFLETQRKAIEIALSNKELELKDAEIKKIAEEISKIAFDKQLSTFTAEQDTHKMQIEVEQFLQTMELEKTKMGVNALGRIGQAIVGALLLKK